MVTLWPDRPYFGLVPTGSCPYGCADRAGADAFNGVLRDETRFGVTFEDLVTNHVGWYFDEDEGGFPAHIRELNLTGGGVYILWRFDGYCDVHGKDLQKAHYAGKAGGNLTTRILHAFRTRELGAGGATTEVTVWYGPNRQAKYLEQLLLDHFSFSKNGAENRGTRALRIPVGEDEWN